MYVFIRICQHKSENYLSFVANERFAWLLLSILPIAEMHGSQNECRVRRAKCAYKLSTVYGWVENLQSYYFIPFVSAVVVSAI